jgi:hydroxymethylglutaryl-CoA lyase
MFKNIPKKVDIIEVGPRDGLQNEKTIISLEDKIKLIELIKESNVKCIEAASFVRPDKVLQMSDGSSLNLGISHLNDVEFVSLVPNIKGLESAISSGVKSIAVFTSISNSFNLKNINSNINDSLDKISEVTKAALKQNIRVRAYVSCAFGCPYEGKTDISKFLEVSRKLLDMGAYEISIGDTIGIANPLQVQNFLEEVLKKFKTSELAMHFHDTRGLALANILVSLEHGISRFDSSLGGLGGCPYALGATGNVATEDLVFMLHEMGIQTGIDLNKLAIASKFILEKLNKKSNSKNFQLLINKKE